MKIRMFNVKLSESMWSWFDVYKEKTGRPLVHIFMEAMELFVEKHKGDFPEINGMQ